MSLIDDVLILADSQGGINLADACQQIKTHQKQIIASTLGRLSAKKYLLKKSTGNESSYSITPIGRKYINSILERIKKYSSKRSSNQSWQMVIFNIPEKQRGLRDTLRHHLINWGFGKLQDSLWISYNDFTAEIQELIKSLNIQDRLINLFTNQMSIEEEKQLVNRLSWNWRDLNASYKHFLNQANKFLVKKNKDPFTAKQIVFQFAKIIQKDPKLPTVLQPKNALINQAYALYLKIRPFCYQ